MDSSVWIDFLSSAPGPGGRELRRMIYEAEAIALTGFVVTEVLQGLWREARIVERYLFQWPMLEPRGFSTYREAAAIFRLARGKGIAITTIDSLIAALALEHHAPLFTLDKDFARIAAVTRLPIYVPPL